MDPSPYAGTGAGAGGKIRRRPPPRASSATPYERPPAAAAAHRLAAAAAAASAGPSGGEGGGGGAGWVSRLVDPASRLITGGAARLFSSVFRKRLDPARAAALPSPSGRTTEPNQDLPESTYVDSTPVLEAGMGNGKNPAGGTTDDKALSEVEHLLMRKTFTRVEFDRLTDLLRARTIESDLPTSTVSPEEKNDVSMGIDGTGRSTTHGMAVDYSPTVKVATHDVSSPAELAKQYMSSRYSREPQSSSLRSRLFLENKGEARNIAYDRRSVPPIAQAPIEFGNENPGIPVNGYVTPGLRGRSAICRMSRSPYFKGPSSSNDVNMSSLSQRTQSLHTGGRQVLKRRGADLENEVGSVGPIRRIRQKSNMMSSFRDARANPRGNHLTSRGSDITEDNSSIQESPSSKRLLLGTGQSMQPSESHKHGGDSKSSDNIPPVPPQSNKMADMIFEQLNRIVPSPKEKPSGKQSVPSNASHSMSKKPVLQDKGQSSMCDPSTSLKFHDVDGANGPLDHDLNGSLLKKDKLKLIHDGSSKVTFSDKSTIFGSSVSDTTSRKPGFKMAVLEDLSELDDDLEVPIPSKNSSSKIEVEKPEQKFDSNRKEQKIEQNILEKKVESNLPKENAVGSFLSDQPTTSISKTAPSSGLISSSDPEKTDTSHASAENNSGFAFSNPGGRPRNTESAIPVALMNDDKQTGASSSIFGLKQSSASDLGTSTVDLQNKAALGQSVTKPTTLDSSSSERGGNRERVEDVIQSSDKVSAASTTANAPLHVTAASTPPVLSNGFSYASPPKLSAVASTDRPAVTSAPLFATSSSSPAISSSSPALNFASSASVDSSIAASIKSESAEPKPASTLLFGIGGTTTEAKSAATDSTSKPASTFSTSRISSNIATFSSCPITSESTLSSVSTFSSFPVAASRDATGSTTNALSSTSSTAHGVQSASTASNISAFGFSSGNSSIFGFSSPAQSTGLSTSVASNTSQPSATSAIFGSKPKQSEGTMSQPSQSSQTQFGSPFPTSSGAGASSSGSGSISFGISATSTGSRTMSFGLGASSSAPGTFSFGAGASSSGPGTVSFGVGATSSGPGTTSFGAGATSSGPGTVSFGLGATSSGPGNAPFGAGAASSGPGTVSFGVGATSSGPGTVPFGAGAASSGSGTVSFGLTASSSGSGFGNSPFGTGSTLSNPFSSSSGAGFTFSSPSSSAGLSAVASTSVFTGTSTASSAPSLSNPFSSSSSTPSTLTFGQPASSGSGFAFGAQSATAFSSQPSPFSFTAANTSMNSSAPQPAFGLTNTNTGFGVGSTGNDQMNDDSMADDTNQGAPAPAPIFGSPFGQQGSSSAAPVFGAPAVQPSGVFQFGGQQQGSTQQNPAFLPGGSLEFQTGNFSLGSGGGGGDKSSRRVIKVKRTAKKR